MTTSQILENDKAQAEEQLAKQIFEIIEHFKQEDPVGLPVVPLQDPTVRKFLYCFEHFLDNIFRKFPMLIRAYRWQIFR